MEKEIITICDLTHTASGSYATNLMPYPIASIKSNLLQFSKHENKFEIEIWHLTNTIFSIFTVFGIYKITSNLFDKKVG